MRISRGGGLAAGGAFALALATFLPWYTLPGGALERVALALRKTPIPAVGSAWNSLGVTSILLVALVLVGIALAASAATTQDSGFRLAVGASAYGIVVALLIYERLFIQRPGTHGVTVVGAGGYLGLIAAVAIAAGAVMVAGERRARSKRNHERRAQFICGAPAVALAGSGTVVNREPAASAGRGAPPLSAPSRAGLPPAGTSAPQLAEERTRPGGRLVRIGLAIASIVAVYLATRARFVGRFPPFLDEAIYADWTAQGAQSAHKLFISLSLGQGPLQPWLAIVWLKLGFSSLNAVRLVSVTSGLLTAAVVGLLGRRFAGAPVGWVSAALCVVLPFFVVHDGIGIYEPLVTLIMASALYVQLEMARHPSLRLGGLLALVLGAGVLTKENTLPALALLPVSLLCFDWSPRFRAYRLRTWLLGVAMALAAVFAAEVVLHSSSYYAQLQACRKSFLCWPARSVSQVLAYPFADSGQAWATYRPALIGYVTVPLIAASAIGAVSAWRSRPRPTAVLLTWILVPFMIALLFELRPFPRHVMYLMPPAVVLMAYAIVWGARWARRALTPRVAVIACVAAASLLLAPALILDGRVLADPATAPYPGLDYWQYVAGRASGLPWSRTADFIRQRGTGRQVVILEDPTGMLQLLFWHDPHYILASGQSPLAARAQFAVTAGRPLSTLLPAGRALQAQREFVLVRNFSRPAGPCSGPRETGCGGTVSVFERRR